MKYLCLQNSVFPEISADFPDIARTLTALKTLAMIGYSEYDSFPDNFSGLSSLVTLKLKFLRIEHLPPSITKLHSLKRLLLNKLHIQEMPHDLSTLSNLKSLKISQCRYLYKIDMGFMNCPKLSKVCFRDRLVEHDPRQPDTHIFWKLAQLGPTMRDLPMLCIQGSFPEQFDAISEALQAWPLFRATEVVFDKLLRPSSPGDPIDDNEDDNKDECIVNINQENLRIVHGWNNTQEKVMAFCMVMHSRVGGASLVHTLEELTMSTVVDMVMGRAAYETKCAVPFATINSVKSLEDFIKFNKEEYELDSENE